MFQGRYKAILVEKDAYLLALARYLVLNPVRAGMVAGPGDWPWSRYHAVVGNAPVPDWLQVDWLLAQFSPDRQVAIRLYIDFVRSGVGLPPIWQALVGQVFLGSESFVAELSTLSAQADNPEIPRAQCRPLAKPLADYFAGQERQQGIVSAYASSDYSLQQIASYLGIHYSTVSRIVKKHEGGM